jgi:catechol 2,3-dioxygenase-like lactoylglutathione lyase family enzyme
LTISHVRLNHAVLVVSDLERSVGFYSDTFGMVLVVREPRANAACLRPPRSGNDHDLELFRWGRHTQAAWRHWPLPATRVPKPRRPAIPVATVSQPRLSPRSNSGSLSWQ